MRFIISLLILFFCVIAIAQPLPTFLPGNNVDLETANYAIAKNYAPIIHQMTESSTNLGSPEGVADLILSVYFDGDFNVTNNWPNLTTGIASSLSPNPNIDLSPEIYYSVVWSEDYWVVTYAFYHPFDWSSCCFDVHNQDLEGMILYINRDDGTIFYANSISHNDLLEYNVSTVPEAFVDNRGHAVELNLSSVSCIDDDSELPCDNCLRFNSPHVTYTHNDDNVANINGLISADIAVNKFHGSAEYKLTDIFTSDPTGMYESLNNSTALVFSSFDINKFATNPHDYCFPGENSTKSASAPWGWSQYSYEDGLIRYYCSLYSGNEVDDILFNPYFQRDCNTDYIMYLDEDQELPSSLEPYKGLVIEENVTVTITDKVLRMVEDGKIELKSGATLIIDNTTITKCNNSPYDLWDGIYALDESASIHITNGSIIEFSKAGISNTNEILTTGSSINPDSDWWQNPYPMSNGSNLSVDIDGGSIFRDNNHCLTIVRGNNNSDISVNDSYFYGKTDQNQNAQFGSTYGIGYFNKSEGSFEVRNCYFEGFSRAIQAWHSSIDFPILSNDFKNNHVSIRVFDAENIMVQLNKFSSQNYSLGSSTSGVQIQNGSAIVANGNIFDNTNWGVMAWSNYPTTTSVQIGNLDYEANEFRNIKLDAIRAFGIDGFRINGEIQNNYIKDGIPDGDDGSIAIVLGGDNNVDVSNNTIDHNPFGILSSSTGGILKSQRCNEFLWNDESNVTVSGDNSGLEILQNSFTGTWVPADIVLSEHPKLYVFQGNIDNPADNCFEDNVQEVLFDTENGTITPPSTNLFNYFKFENQNAANCLELEPEANQQNLFIVNPTFDEGENCLNGMIGSNFVIPPNPPNEIDKLDDVFRDWIDIVDPDCHPCIRDSIDVYVNHLIDAGIDNPFTYVEDGTGENSGEYSQQEVKEIRKRFHLLMMLAIRYGILKEDYEYTESILQPYKQWYWQTRLYGFYMKSRQMNKAAQLLNQLPDNTSDEQAFNRIQQINQKLYDVNGINISYDATQAELSDLVSLAKSNNTSSAYANGVYFSLTGNHIRLDVPTPDRPIQNRSVDFIEESVNAIMVYPNPTSQYISINSPENVLSLEVVGFDGKLIKTVNRPQYKVSVKDIPSGLYLVYIQLIEGENIVQKLVIE